MISFDKFYRDIIFRAFAKDIGIYEKNMSPIFHKTKHALKAEKKLIKKLNYKIINNKIIIIKPPSTTPPLPQK